MLLNHFMSRFSKDEQLKTNTDSYSRLILETNSWHKTFLLWGVSVFDWTFMPISLTVLPIMVLYSFILYKVVQYGPNQYRWDVSLTRNDNLVIFAPVLTDTMRRLGVAYLLINTCTPMATRTLRLKTPNIKSNIKCRPVLLNLLKNLMKAMDPFPWNIDISTTFLEICLSHTYMGYIKYHLI